MQRRQFVLGIVAAPAGATWAGPCLATPGAPPVLAAAWQQDQRHFVGLLGLHDAALRVVSALEVPTRAHGLSVLPDGRLLAVARRPGDWLLRWRPGDAATTAAWHWAAPGVVFNGHALPAPAVGGRARVLVTQTDVDTGDGQVGVLDAATLEPLDAWPTAGQDPHALLMHEGLLWVANGGIPTRPETGRIKRDLDRMDASLVSLSPATGRLRGRWQLPDARLSLRHLAARPGLIGVALQAEHDEPAVRERAPLLAVFDGERLHVPAPPAGGVTGGYAGDIVAWRDGFVVSATRAHRALHWRARGGWQGDWPLADAGPLAARRHGAWLGGRTGLRRLGAADAGVATVEPAFRLDNHWTTT